MGLASATFSAGEEKVLCVDTEESRRLGTCCVLSSLELGMLNLRCLGDIFVEIASQKFEAQKSFRSKFRVCQHHREEVTVLW